VLSDQAKDAEPPQQERLLQRLMFANAHIPLAADFTRRYLEKYQEKLVVVRNRTDLQRLMEMLISMKSLEMLAGGKT